MSAPRLEAAYGRSGLTLARLLPRARARHAGLLSSFVDLGRLAEGLALAGDDGALVVGDGGDATAVALLFEGRLVGANARGPSNQGPVSAGPGGESWGAPALAELARQFADGASLDVLGLDRRVAHALCGLSERPWRSGPPENFTGVSVSPDGLATLFWGGEPVASLAAGPTAPGTYPAPLRPAPMALPRPTGPWASARYALTLRGRDALNPITDAHARTRQALGRPGLDLLAQLGRGLTPLETGLAVAELEPLVSAILRDGLARHDGP